jgi:hypothetical protein
MVTYYVTLFFSLLLNYLTHHLFYLGGIYVTSYVTPTMSSLRVLLLLAINRLLQMELGSDGWVPCGGINPPRFKSQTWYGCLHLPGFILGLPGAILIVVVMCSSTARRLWWLHQPQDLPARSFRDAHRGRVCVCAFIGVSVPVIRLQRIYIFWCSMLIFTPFAYCFVTHSGTFMHFPELTY